MDALSRTVVVMALAAEADGVFAAAGIDVLYCGIGKVNAARALARELARYAHAGHAPPLVVNFGSAGSRRYPAGSFCACHQFVQRDMDLSVLGYPLGVTPFEEAPPCLQFAPLFAQLPQAVCGSGDSFATTDAAVACDVLDMEAYALAKTCWFESAPFACVKYITDGADHAAADAWRSNVHKAAEEFLRLYRLLPGTPNGERRGGS
ncbi:MAG TPA: 5'-nucleosidase [Steroidobacteraceae bacterium]|nr:5'-nucleosidase [Steroidobacteraceae bacterium]